MKTFIWTVHNKISTKYGYRFDVKVYQVVNNVPRYYGQKQDINSGSMLGAQSEALSVLYPITPGFHGNRVSLAANAKEGIIPSSYVQKTNGYYDEARLEKLGIRFIGV